MTQQGIEVVEAEPGCAHHWAIESPNGPTSYGTCKRCGEIRERLRRSLFDWTQLTTRYGNTWPHQPPGADGKATLAGLRSLLDAEQVFYL